MLAAPFFRALDGLLARQRHGFVASLIAWPHETRRWWPTMGASDRGYQRRILSLLSSDTLGGSNGLGEVIRPGES